MESVSLTPDYEQNQDQPLVNLFAMELGYTPDALTLTPVDGGHMAYHRLYIDTPEGKLFAKGHAPELFTDPVRESHARSYLEKEQMIFEYLRSEDYQQVPTYSTLLGGSVLVMNAFPAEEGWCWRAPKDAVQFQDYVESVLASLDNLQNVPLPPLDHFFPKRILKVYNEEGWDFIDSKIEACIQSLLTQWNDRFYPETRTAAAVLSSKLPELVEAGKSIVTPAQQYYLAHHDFRQANIGWHQELGTQVIDWSWADIGPKHADSTMLLIDLTKSGYDISPYMQSYFNPEHAAVLMGHWLGRSVEPTRDGDPTIRFHQLTSAITAFDLLSKYRFL